MASIDVRNLTKTYRLGIGRARVREMLPSPIDRVVAKALPGWWHRNTFDALSELSFSVDEGSSVGVVGHNGAGKTTLLRVLAGVSEPTRGRVRVSGNIAALIDVMVGFNPELTGRENIEMLGAMLGYNRRAMTARLPEVLGFAEIGNLVDTPLKRYSAGMITRVGFSTLTALDIDVLLVDEVLAVGDATFQRKCIGWLEGYRKAGGTLLFVSHNLGLVRNMTDRVIWLDHGKLVADGETSTILAAYGKAMEKRDSGAEVATRNSLRAEFVGRGQHRWGAGGVRVEEADFDEISEDGSELGITIRYEASEIGEAVFALGFIDESGREVGVTASPPVSLAAHGGEVTCRISPLPLRTGIYFPVVAILSSDGLVRDRWRLDRAVVVQRAGEIQLGGEFGSADIAGHWANGHGHA